MKKNLIRIPVDSHGLHRNNFNFPSALTMNFMDVAPVFAKEYRKGEKLNLKGGLFSRLNALPQPAFCTGRYNLKAFFVPYKYVFKPWYYFDNGTEYLYSTGSVAVPTKSPYTLSNHFDMAFVNCLVPLVTADGSSTDYDISYLDGGGTSNYYHLTYEGCKVMRILNMLGYTPQFNYDDHSEINILPLLTYIRAFVDYYFPKGYVGNYVYNNIVTSIVRENDFYDNSAMGKIMESLYYCSCIYYDNSLLDIAFDKPVSSNTGVPEPSVSISDVTNNGTANIQVVTNDPNSVVHPSAAGTYPSNGTPFVGSTGTAATTSAARGVITQYVIDSLQKLNNYVQKHRLAGGRLLERFLVQRGIPIEKDYIEEAYFLGERDVEIDVSAVTNNSNTNLGELAGMGIAGTNKDKPLSFKFTAPDDGYLFVICSCVADSNPVIYNDPIIYNTNPLDHYHAVYDKLGPELIPSSVAFSSNNGFFNKTYIMGKGFGFHQRYYYRLMEQTRLAGDFRVPSRGQQSLYGFHTFRLPSLGAIQNDGGYYHSFNYLNSNVDGQQFSRIFYSTNVDNLQLFFRWFGDEYLEKLPLGDSYDWNDDEFNKKVTVVSQGNPK